MQTSANPQQILLGKIEDFIRVSKKVADKQTAETLSLQLTACIKEDWFFPLAHQLLTNSQSFNSDKRDKEILISSFVKDKFKYEFESLDIANVESHYRQLCEIAFALRNSSYAAYTNVALALAYTYLHLVALHQHPIQNYLNALRPDKEENIKLYNIYFKTLEYVATEIDNTKFVMDQTHRETAKQRLNAQQLAVLQLLNLSGVQAFSSGDINKQNILNAFQAWISLQYDANVLNNIANHTLFKLTLEHINDEECGEGASNCLRSIIYQLKDPQQNAVVYQALSSSTLQILSLVQNHVKNLQLDKAQDFLRIIADFSRKSIDLFIQNYDNNIESYLKKLISYLQDDLMNTYETLADFFQDYIHALKQAKKKSQNINPSIYAIIDPLYTALCYKCQIPSRIMKELNITEQSKAHHISTAAEQLFKNREFTEQIFQMLGDFQGKQNYVKMVVDKILGIGSNDQKVFWPNLQSFLFSVTNMVKQYPSLDESLVNLVKIYVQLSSKPEPIPICVRRTFLRVFRSILYVKTKDVEFLYRIMCVAVSCFDQPLLMAVAQKTFCRACQENKDSATSIFSQFGVVIEKYPNREYIVKGLMVVLCCEGTLITQYLHQVLTFLMKKYKEQTSKNLRKQYMYSIVAALKVFKESPVSVQYMNIFLQFTKDVWPYIKQVLGNPLKPKDDEDSDIQRMVRILKIIMRILQLGFSQFLEQLFTIVLAAFQKYPICSYVYLVEVAVTVYAKNPAYSDYLRRLYSSFCDIAFHHMQKIEDISRFSYLLDDFMGMNKRFFLHNASIILSSGKLSSIIDLAINAFMGCDIPRVAKAAYSFFETVFIVYWPIDFLQQRNTEQDITPFMPLAEDAKYYQALKEYLVQRLEQIIAKMLQHLASAPTEQTRDYILDALLSEVKGFIPENPTVWSELLMKIPSQILVQRQKERMIQVMKSLQGAVYEPAKGLVKALDKMLVLMNQRLVNANKRKVIIF